ncbi:hypothetical protein [Prosthecobacter sp.]|uniref:hypothetical protein n=1 Tax=Prosthecobacter sp. TaxID=1965333 RepID=UPI003784AABA
MKGHSEKKLLEITIHYGLDPVVGQCLSTKWEWDKSRGPVALGDPTVIGIWDTGGLDIPITDDVREPHIWLLTTKNPGYTTPESEDRPGIWEPCHLQAITQKEKLKKIISQK